MADVAAKTAAKDCTALLGRLKSMFQEAQAVLHDGRFIAMRNRDYYDGAQYTDAEIETLRLRKQPPIVSNRIKRKVDFLVGMEIRTRADPEAKPRKPKNEEKAEVATDVLRYLQDDTKFPITATDVASDVFVEGVGGVEVIAVQKKFRIDVQINQLAFNIIFYDPHSARKDFKDARYLGYAKWMDKDDAKAVFGAGTDAEDTARRMDAIDCAFSDSGMESGFDDRPSGAHAWTSPDRKRLLIVCIYHRVGGVWNYGIYSGGGVIESGVSPYVDQDGEPDCAIILTSCYIRKRTNDRYGVVSDMIGPQDEVNHRRSKMLHMLNVRQFKIETGAVDDIDATRRALARPDAAIEVKANKMFEILDNSDQISGQAELLREAKDEIEQLGPNAGLIGRGVEDASGRSIQAQQQAGMTELAQPYDNLRDFRERVYVASFCRASQFWTDEKIIRVSDNDGAPKYVTLNERVPVPNPITGGPMIDPATGQLVTQLKNNLQEMDVDVVLDEGVDVTVLSEEQFSDLKDLAKMGIVFPPEVYIRASNLRNKADLLKTLKEAGQKSPQATQTEQDANDAAMEKVIAEIGKDHASAALTAAQAEKVQVETAILVGTSQEAPIIPPAPSPPVPRPAPLTFHLHQAAPAQPVAPKPPMPAAPAPQMVPAGP